MAIGFNQITHKDDLHCKKKDVYLHIVFNHGESYQFEIDTKENALTIVRIFMEGGRGVFQIDSETVINLTDVSAISIEDKLKGDRNG